MQPFGQHFLKNPVILRKIAESIDPKEGELIIEIGPGHGELTRELLPLIKKAGAKLVLIEKDGRLIPDLQNLEKEGVLVVHGDALLELSRISKEAKNGFKVIGNVPYYITGFLMRVLSELETKPSLTVFTIQKEVGERIVAIPPKSNKLSLSTQIWAEPKILFTISKKEFSPPPQVDSVTIKLETKSPQVEAGNYYETLRALFSQPRKTILNNLATQTKIEKKNCEEILHNLGISPSMRPENLTVLDVMRIGRSIK